MRNGRNDEKRTKSDPVNRIKSDQIRPNQTKSNQIKPNQTGRVRIKAAQGAGRSIKTGADEAGFRSRALAARRF
jgi:hypothetical protein